MVFCDRRGLRTMVPLPVSPFTSDSSSSPDARDQPVPLRLSRM
jgi:hypothetical protein